MSAPTIAPLPAPPARAEAPADFTSKMDAFVAALPDFATQANAAAAFVGTAAASNLSAWALVQNFTLVSRDSEDSNGTLLTAHIKWPDGTLGIWTTDAVSVAFPGAIDAWHATYLGNPVRTITQPAFTRNANGAVTAQPDLIIV